MKEGVLEILIYLFENYISHQPDLATDPDVLAMELEEAGFERSQIDNAFVWLQEVVTTEIPENSEMANAVSGIRVYTPEECSRLSVNCRGFLHALEQGGLLKFEEREIIIDYVLGLNLPKIDLKLLKWLVFMVIFHKADVIGDKKLLAQGEIILKPEHEKYH